MELREYVSALRRRWLWLLVPVLVCLGATAGITLAAPPQYRSQTVLYVTTGAGDPDAKASRLNSYIALLTGPRVANAVIAETGLPLTTEEMQDRITAQVQDGTDLLAVAAVDGKQETSRIIVTTATAVLIDLARQLDPPNPDAEGPVPSVSVAQEPVTTRDPSNLARNLGFSAALGLLLGAAAIALLQATRRTVTEPDDLRRLGLGTVGVIALGGRTGRQDEALAEAFRRLRSLLPDPSALARDGARGTALMLTGPNPQEGTTTVATGLAIAMAETGARVVLVDANMREPGVGRFLTLDPAPGLADVLTGSADVHDVLQDTLDGRLTVLAAGERPADPGEALASPRLGDTLRELKDTFDVVLLDAPPLATVADAAVLGKATDSSLLVVRAGHSRAGAVAHSVELLEKVGAAPAGAVLNALPRKLSAGSAWQRDSVVSGAAPDAELVAGLYGPPDGDGDTDESPTSPVRGRARVVIDQEDENANLPVPYSSARGRARVVSITDAKPPAVPAPRAARDDEEPTSGE